MKVVLSTCFVLSFLFVIAGFGLIALVMLDDPSELTQAVAAGSIAVSGVLMGGLSWIAMSVDDIKEDANISQQMSTEIVKMLDQRTRKDG